MTETLDVMQTVGSILKENESEHARREAHEAHETGWSKLLSQVLLGFFSKKWRSIDVYSLGKTLQNNLYPHKKMHLPIQTKMCLYTSIHVYIYTNMLDFLMVFPFVHPVSQRLK